MLVRPQIHRRAALSVALAAALGLGLWILLLSPPEQNRFAPPCPLHQATGLNCPGCGATRCLYALLHGDLAGAARKNLLAFFVIPWLTVVFVRKWWRWICFQPPPLPKPDGQRSSFWPKAVAAVIIAFSILRNLPWPPFSWLAPH